MTRQPSVTVAVPSHDRADRLRRLLDGLERQTLPPDAFEVVVCHDSRDHTEELLRSHPLATAGVLSHIHLTPGEGRPARQRNRAWRAGSAPLVAFIDDDCRPHPGWLESLVQVAGERPGSVVQGATRPDPDEAWMLERPYARSLDVQPPSLWGEGCNIAYPRALLERLDGFAEEFAAAAGEDTDLLLRARSAGAAHVPAPDALVWHAVDASSLAQRVRSLRRWQHGVLLVRRQPGIRAHLPGRVFWKPSHVRLLPALLALVLLGVTRRPGWVVLALPWLRHRGHWYGPAHAIGSARVTTGELIIDVAELAVVLRGSARYRTLLL